MNRSFSLIAVNLPEQKNSHIQKILHSGIYVFDKRYTIKDKNVYFKVRGVIDTVIDDLYGENVRVQAIVGKNGSGKSSLLDIICRIINNLSFSLLVESLSVSLYNIDELVADLYYIVDNQCYCISCMNKQLEWRRKCVNDEGEDVVIFSSSNSKSVDIDYLRDKCKKLFYTIVTNYSPHSLIPDEYRTESVDRFYYDFLFDRYDTSWLPNLFHKNDGYLTPITLVPYRENNGSIDMSKELKLSRYRLSSIFLFYRYKDPDAYDGNAVIDSYSLDDIFYTYAPSNATEKCRRFSTSDQLFTYRSGNAIGRQLLKHLGYDERFPNGRKDNNLYEYACIYLASKIFHIVCTYPSYQKYRSMFFDDSYDGDKYVRNGLNSPVPSNYYREEIKNLIDQINNDPSHITIKVRQTKALLNYIKECDQKQEDYTWLTEKFGYAEYMEKVHHLSYVKSMEEIQLLLPPPVFNVDLLLEKSTQDVAAQKIKIEKKIELSSLSSGERQLLFVLSTYVYHTLNLISNAKDPQRISYPNLCLLLDEVEICFHPDYQRQFINRLVNVLKDMGLTKEFSFYILLATHSPFMLSDIPQQNILYLEDGQDVSSKIEVNPFCANVNDILYQSFFLRDGFSGAFATNKVKSLIEYLKSPLQSTIEWNIQTANIFINKVIGDQILRDALRAMYDHKMNTYEKDIDK